MRFPLSVTLSIAAALAFTPLLSAVARSSSAASPEEMPQVAYDPTLDLYLVVWQRVNAGYLDFDIVGQRVRADGTKLGDEIQIHNPSPAIVPYDPTVTAVGNGLFVVTYSTLIGSTMAGGAEARSLDGRTGALSAVVTLAFSGTADSVVAVGDPSGSGSVLLAWRESSGMKLRRGIAAPQSLTLVGSVVTQQPGLTEMRMAMDESGRVLIAGLRFTWLSYQRNELLALVLDPGLGRLGTAYLGDPEYSQSLPDVDSHGDRWIVTYGQLEQPRTISNVVPRDLLCQEVVVTTTGNLIVSGPHPLSATPGLDEYSPRIASLDDSCVLTYSASSPAGDFAMIATIDPFGCTICEASAALGPIWPGQLAVGPLGPSRWGHTAAARRLGTGEGLVAWAEQPSPSVRYRRFTVADGIVTDLGGGCGRGGEARATCAIVGNSAFTHRLRNGPPFTPAFLALSTTQHGFGCGPCSFQPDLGRGLVAPAGNTDLQGHAALTTPIPATPSLIGQSLVEQWLVFVDGSSCLRFGCDMSNAVRIMLE